MQSHRRRQVLGLLGAAAGGVWPVAVRAQAYPAKPILVVVGYPPGSATDFIARLLGPKMAEGLGQPFVIENRPGASGVVAAGAVSRAAPDGYTIMASVPASTTAARAMFRDKLQYSPETDLVPIGLVGVSPLVLVAPANTPIRTAADFLAAARSASGGLNIGSYGVGSPSHFAIEMLRTHSRVPLVHVPHSGPAAMQTALLSGVIPVAIDSVTSALPQINAGKLLPLAVTAARRSTSLPAVPTTAEAGLGNVETAGWVGFHAPKGTPAEIVQKLNAELNRVLSLPDVRQQLGTRIELAGGTPAAFASYLQAETERLNRITQDAKLTFE
ncbi:MAG TPA: tripartite tricarboxylate transporter substrate binding protein [Ramlibacter sp.]|nr:tripartite tricarboxylate transporter substrate binding protein [Ramlibacter sp.]